MDFFFSIVSVTPRDCVTHSHQNVSSLLSSPTYCYTSAGQALYCNHLAAGCRHVGAVSFDMCWLLHHWMLSFCSVMFSPQMIHALVGKKKKFVVNRVKWILFFFSFIFVSFLLDRDWNVFLLPSTAGCHGNSSFTRPCNALSLYHAFCFSEKLE